MAAEKIGSIAVEAEVVGVEGEPIGGGKIEPAFDLLFGDAFAEPAEDAGLAEGFGG